MRGRSKGRGRRNNSILGILATIFRYIVRGIKYIIYRIKRRKARE